MSQADIDAIAMDVAIVAAVLAAQSDPKRLQDPFGRILTTLRVVSEKHEQLQHERELMLKMLGLRELATKEGWNGSLTGLEMAAEYDAEADALLAKIRARKPTTEDHLHDFIRASSRYLVRALRAEKALRDLRTEIAAYVEHSIGCPEWYRQHRDADGKEPPATEGKPCDCGLDGLLKGETP